MATDLDKFTDARTGDVFGGPSVESAVEPPEDLAGLRKLVTRVAGRTASDLEEVRWAKDHLFFTLAELGEGALFDSIPSAGALAWWHIGAGDPGGFMQKIGVRLLPSRAQVETLGLARDDGRAVTEAIEHLERMRADAEG